MFKKKNNKEENNKEEISKAQAPKEETSQEETPKAQAPIAVTLKAADQKEDAPKEEKKSLHKQKLAMVPLFSWRTIIVVGIGVVGGAILGILYYIIAPSLSSSGVNLEEPQQQSGGLFGSFGPAASGPWQSDVNVEILTPELSSMTSRDIQNLGEYYTSRANSLPFLEYLSNELSDEEPEYRYSINQLAQMVSAQLDISRETPIIEFTAVTPTVEETTFLIAYVPVAYKDFLVSESVKEQQQEYENTLESIEDVKAAILEAEDELSQLGPQGAASDIQNAPDYIALNAKIDALGSELENQAENLAVIISLGNGDYPNIVELEYQNILQRTKDVTVALNEAEQKLQDIIEQNSGYTSITSNPDYIILEAKVRALENQLDLLMNGDINVVGLASMIAEGNTTSSTYNLALEKVETVGAALSEARTEMASLESQAGSIEDNLEYQLAQADVNTLELELADLRERLSELASQSAEDIALEPDTKEAFRRTSEALAEARKELAILQSQSGGEYLEIDLEYQLVQDKINTMNAELSVLNNRLGTLLVTDTEVEELVDYLSIRNAEIPTPIMSVTLRTALLIGAVFGIAIAWVILNFRWLTKGFSSSADEDEEEE